MAPPPVEPPATRWDLPDAQAADESGIVGVGADLEPGTLLAAYRRGLFPMRLPDGPLAWWSPDPRAIVPLDGVHVSRSLRRSRRRFETRCDTAFDEVIAGCADRDRPGGWIDASFVRAYRRLFDLGWVHSIETWHDGRLVGGLYGVRIGRFFAGESMFHRETDASKAALVATAEWLAADDATLFDVQWLTPHLASMGAIEIPRAEYLCRLADAIAQDRDRPDADR